MNFLFKISAVSICLYRSFYVAFDHSLDKNMSIQAAEIFEEAQAAGKGMCGIYPEEQAELYVEQFTRCEPIIYADMEKEGKQPKVSGGA